MSVKFNRIYLEIGNVCNLSCDFCPKTTREKRQINLQDFSKIVDKTSHLSDYFYLHLMGEPTYHPDLSKFLEVLYFRNKKAVIVTNGTMLKSVGDMLLNSKSLYKIVISLHSFEANKKTSSFEEYVNSAVSYAKSALMTTTQIVVLRLWNLGEGAKNSRNDFVLEAISQAFDVEISDIESSLFTHDVKLAPRIFLERADKFEWVKSESDSQNKKFCYALRSHFGILVDGTVVPCCLDNDGDLGLGNVLKDDIDDILSSEKARAIYDSFTKRSPAFDRCLKCGYAERF